MIRRGDLDSAADVLSGHLSQHGVDQVAQELLAHVYRKQAHYPAVKRHLLKALNSLEGDPSSKGISERARLMNNVGAACVSIGDLEEAADWFARSLAAAPGPIAFENLHDLNYERGDLGACRQMLLRWLEIFPEDRTAALLTAINHAEAGDRESGIEELTQLIQSGSTDPRAYAALGYLLTDHQRDLETAVQVLSTGFENFPTDVGIENNLAYVHLMRGEPEHARRVLEGLKQKEIEDSIYLTATWGLLRLWEGDVAAAVHCYRAAGEKARQEGRRQLAKRVNQKMHLEMARYHLRLNEPQSAAREVKLGLATGGDGQYREDLKRLGEKLLTSAPLLASGELQAPTPRYVYRRLPLETPARSISRVRRAGLRRQRTGGSPRVLQLVDHGDNVSGLVVRKALVSPSNAPPV